MIIKAFLARTPSARRRRSKFGVASASEVANDSKRVRRGDKNCEKHGEAIKAAHAALRSISKPKRDIVLGTSVSGFDGSTAALIGVMPLLRIDGRPLVKVLVDVVHAAFVKIERNGDRLTRTDFAPLRARRNLFYGQRQRCPTTKGSSCRRLLCLLGRSCELDRTPCPLEPGMQSGWNRRR